MKRSVIGDPHLTHKSLDRGEQLFELVESLGLPATWTGDFLDTKEVIRGKCFNALVAYLHRSKLHHIIIVGNHDYFNLDCLAHSLETLKLLPNVTIVDRPMVIDGIVYFPYMRDVAKLRAAIAEFQGPDRVLFAHLEVSQFDFGNGHVCTNGLSLDELAGFKRVISGHFHKYQTSGNLTYIGTPFSHSFGEANQTKYIGMYDSDTDDFRIAETPFPRHISMQLETDNFQEQYIDQLHDEFDPQNFYRVILTGTQVGIDAFPKEAFSKFNVKWVSRPSDHVENQVTIEDTVSNEAQFVKWATTVRKMDEETTKLGLQIMEACR